MSYYLLLPLAALLLAVADYYRQRPPETPGILHYKEGYKYQVTRDITLRLAHIRPANHIRTLYLFLDEEGRLTVSAGYAWDGPSGPTLDTPDFMAASLLHDALYQMFRQGLLPRSLRLAADLEMRDQARADGMSPQRQFVTRRGVSRFAAFAADSKSARQEIAAP